MSTLMQELSDENTAADALAAAGYAVINMIGRGSFGMPLERCEDVAVKVSIDENARKVALSEAEIMAAIPRHPNVMPLSDVKCTSETVLLAMPFATGGDTLSLMRARNCIPLPESEIHDLFTQLVDAVSHLHEHGFVHRDIKCENLLLGGSRRRLLLLADFGLTTRFEKGKCALRKSFGTLLYSAPELIEGEPYEGPELDIWSMGVVLYAWASGRLPFGGKTKAEIRERIAIACYPRQECIPLLLADLIDGMLTVDTKRRLTIAGIRAHPWFVLNFTTPSRAADAESIHRAPATRDDERTRRLSDPKPMGRAGRMVAAVASIFSSRK